MLKYTQLFNCSVNKATFYSVVFRKGKPQKLKNLSQKR